jgi:hypothetical protein
LVRPPRKVPETVPVPPEPAEIVAVLVVVAEPPLPPVAVSNEPTDEVPPAVPLEVVLVVSTVAAPPEPTTIEEST